jgi:hypothetical protein
VVELRVDLDARVLQGALQPSGARAVADEQAAFTGREARLEKGDQCRRLLGGTAVDQAKMITRP